MKKLAVAGAVTLALVGAGSAIAVGAHEPGGNAQSPAVQANAGLDEQGNGSQSQAADNQSDAADNQSEAADNQSEAADDQEGVQEQGEEEDADLTDQQQGPHGGPQQGQQGPQDQEGTAQFEASR